MYRTLFLTIGFFLLTATLSAQDEATFEGLGDLPGGIFHSEANAASVDGSVIVGSSSSEDAEEGQLEAFRWVADPAVVGEGTGEMQPLGDLPGGLGFASQAFDVSADGSVVVGRGVSEDGGEAFRWEDGVMEGLGDFPEGFYLSIANAVSADGSVVTGTGSSENGEEAFRWEDGEMMGLGFLPGDFASQSSDVSADGSVVIGISDFEAYRWEDSVMVGLGFLPGSTFNTSRANAVSTDGSVIVGAGDSEGHVEAFRWEEDEMMGLGAIPDGFAYTEALAVSSDGSVVVGFGGDEFGENMALIWRNEEGTRLLKEMLETDYGLDLGDWVLQEARDISGDGTVIVGVGINPDGDIEGWRAFLGKPIADEGTPEEIVGGLSAPAPNPVRSSASLTLRVAESQHVRVELFDVTGRRVQTLYDGALSAGMRETLTLDTSALPAGVYVIRATGEDFDKTRRVTVVR